MSNKYASLVEKCDFFIGAVYTVSHDGRTGFSAKETKMVIGISIKSGIRAKFFYPGDLSLIFGKVRLYRKTVFSEEVLASFSRSSSGLFRSMLTFPI